METEISKSRQCSDCFWFLLIDSELEDRRCHYGIKGRDEFFVCDEHKTREELLGVNN